MRLPESAAAHYLREGFVEDIKVKDGQLVPGLRDGERSEYARLSLAAGSVEVSGPLVSKVEDAPAEDVYLRFVLDYGTRPLWVADAGTNLMLNRAFAVWEPGKGLLVAFS